MCRSCFVYWSFTSRLGGNVQLHSSIRYRSTRCIRHMRSAANASKLKTDERERKRNKWRAATDSPTKLARRIERILMDEHWALCKLWPFTHMQVNKVQLVRKKANKIFSHSVHPWHNWTCASVCVRMWIAYAMGSSKSFILFVLESKLNVEMEMLGSGEQRTVLSQPVIDGCHNENLCIALSDRFSSRWFLSHSLTHWAATVDCI